MGKFNPNEYETVKERKAKFYEDHKDGRIVVKLINEDNPLEYASFMAKVYFSAEDQEKGLERASGYALEIRDKELSKSNSGREYESVNYSSWTENCEESAIGRALDNAGYSGNKKCSREEVEKAQRMNKTMGKINNQAPVANEADPDAPWCDYHKCAMRINKLGNPYHLDNSRPEGDKFCNGKGFPSEQQAWKTKTSSEKITVKPKDEYDQSVENIEDQIPF